MKRGADLVIIGGGVNGCCLAYHLAKAGYRDVVIVEKGQVASGASGRAPGGFRHQWSTEADILLMTASIRLITGLQEELDHPGDLEVRRIGYLFLVDSEQEMEQFRRNVQLQRRLGIPVEILSPRDARSLVPFLNVDGLVGATFCPWDGRASPYLVTHAYGRAARRLGVQICTETCATGITTNDSRITGVVTDRGVIETSRVACIAGVHSPAIARMVGIENLPIRPSLRQVLITERLVRDPCPALIGGSVGYFQTPNGDVMPALRSPDLETLDLGNTADFVTRTAGAWVRLAPALARMKAVRMWAGSYDMTPDAHPIVGATPGVEGFYLAAGFSGHGFMMAPIVGKSLAEIILGNPPPVDLGALELDRFSRPDHVVERMVI